MSPLTRSERSAAIAAIEKEIAVWRHDLARREAEARLQRLEQYVAATQPYLRLYRDTVGAMRLSPFWRLRRLVFSFLGRLGRPDRSGVDAVSLVDDDSFAEDQLDKPYDHWLRENELRSADIVRMREQLSLLRYEPTISIVTPVYEPPEPFLRLAIESVIDQVYPHWELCLANDASPSSYVRTVLDEYAAIDSRIKVVHRGKNGRISRASNSALELATGDFVALLDHDDALSPDALFEVAAALNRDLRLDMIYSDEDKIDPDGQRHSPFFKPDWAPETLLSRMYVGHLSVFRRTLLEKIGGFRSEYDGSQDYDLVLRFTELTDRIHHIPKVLYHWRVHPDSAASGTGVKTYAYDAAYRALTDTLERRGEKGTVERLAVHPGFFSVRYEIVSADRVSVIIPTRDHAADLDRCLSSIFEKSTYSHFEIIILDNGSTETDALDVLKKWEAREPERVVVVRYDVPFNFSHINNYAVRHSSGRFLLFLNNDTEVIAPGWLEAMIEQAQRSPIGAVGARLLYPDDTIQHAGVVMRINGVASHGHRTWPADAPGYFGVIQTINNFSAVTGACMMMRRDVFDEVGGFEEQLAVAWNDVDLCLRIRERGYRIVYVPHALLYHFESKSRGPVDTPEKREREASEIAFLQRRWNCAERDDPYYSPHLSLVSEDYSIRA